MVKIKHGHKKILSKDRILIAIEFFVRYINVYLDKFLQSKLKSSFTDVCFCRIMIEGILNRISNGHRSIIGLSSNDHVIIIEWPWNDHRMIIE